MLRVKKDGIIKGGEINLAYNPDTEKFAWFGYVKIGVGPLIKKVTFNDDYNIPKDMMRSDGLYVGKKVERDGVIMECVTLHDSYAIINFDSEDVDGLLTVSRSSVYIYVESIKADGKIQGKKIHLEAYK